MREGTRRALAVWSGAVVLFGIGLCGGAFPATDGFVRAAFALLGETDLVFTPALRFAIGLMGAGSLGWGLTLAAAFASAAPVDDSTVRHRIAVSVGAWYIVDDAISIATGYALNVASNTVLLVALIVILWRGDLLARA